jgi:hypothetical protein
MAKSEWHYDASQVKFYTYISDAKVDMLIAQIPHDKRKEIADEFRVDFGIVKASHKEDYAADQTRYARLEAVAKYIKSNEWCAPLNHDAPYILDTLPIRWGRLRRIEGTHGESVRLE